MGFIVMLRMIIVKTANAQLCRNILSIFAPVRRRKSPHTKRARRAAISEWNRGGDAMAIKRKFPPRGATVYCSGGCRAKKDEDGGKIVQRGTHDELIQEDGIYADFVGGKKETAGWKL